MLTSIATLSVLKNKPRIKSFRSILFRKYANKIEIAHDFSRAMVSFQANKNIPFYRWLKYKEAFSSDLVNYFINSFQPPSNGYLRILDPFAGAGTTLTTAAKKGWHSTGIELMPVGVALIRAMLIADRVNIQHFKSSLKLLQKFPLESSSSNYVFPHIRITQKAFTEKTENAISAYMDFINHIKDRDVRYLFWFACLSILEDVSFTRKDGQYLRWDMRSGRSLKSQFSKGHIYDFGTAIKCKLQMMLDDIVKRNGNKYTDRVEIIEGSCLNVLPNLSNNSFDLILTSPPYCNRYDYTRTYALELAFQGYDDDAVKNLRQALLSATVENRSKRQYLAQEYRKRNRGGEYDNALRAFEGSHALHEVLDILHKARKKGELNNNNIPDMIENYFFEINLIIHELARVLAPAGRFVMVNDNVRYHGEEIPVDLLLSDFAENAGLSVDKIWVLPRGKGNSSQQMGAFGRNELRKCVYIWSKPVK
jgi:DNA modification methylase